MAVIFLHYLLATTDSPSIPPWEPSDPPPPTQHHSFFRNLPLYSSKILHLKKRLRGDIFVKWVTAMSFSLTTLNAVVSIWFWEKIPEIFLSAVFYTPSPPSLPGAWSSLHSWLLVWLRQDMTTDAWRLFCLLRYCKCCRKKNVHSWLLVWIRQDMTTDA